MLCLAALHSVLGALFTVSQPLKVSRLQQYQKMHSTVSEFVVLGLSFGTSLQAVLR